MRELLLDQWVEGSLELDFQRFSDLDVSAGLELGALLVGVATIASNNVFSFLVFLDIIKN